MAVWRDLAPPAARNVKTACVWLSCSALTALAVLLYLSRRELLPAPEPLCVLPGIVCICAGLTPSLDVSAHVLPLPVSSPSSLQLLPPFWPVSFILLHSSCYSQHCFALLPYLLFLAHSKV